MKISGFTLLEVVIYLALFSVLLTNVLLAAYSLIDSVAINRAAIAAEAEALFINRKIIWMLENATEVNCINQIVLQVFTTESGVVNPLELTSSDYGIYLKRGDIPQERLTSERFLVTDFRCLVELSPSNRPTFVKISYKINDIFHTYEYYAQQ